MKLSLAVILAAVSIPALAADAPPASGPDAPASAAPAPAGSVKQAAPVAPGDGFKSDDERTAYAYGYQIGKNVSQIGMSNAELKVFNKAIYDAATNKKAAVEMTVYLPKVSDFAQKRAQLRAEAEKKKGRAYADKFAKDADVKAIPNGGFIKTLAAGTGAQPTADDTVKVHYRGTLMDGTEFDSSYKRNEPATFPLKGVIPCWTNGVAMMKVGGKAKLVCPSDVAYGDQGQPRAGIAGGATLTFEIELLDVVKPEAPKADEAKPAPKADAKTAPKSGK